MIAPGIAYNEAERLSVLHQLKILDTEKEERFDRITRIACKLFNVPIAIISFIESERQWMKSTYGFEIQEALRETSFCGHVILTDEILAIEDATLDKRFHDNPYVLGEPKIKFYLGCPLKIQRCNVGAFCIIDAKSRNVAEVDQEVMTDLAHMVELELESLHLATTDELTGLSNRRGFLKIAKYLFQMCQRENKPFSLLFFDINQLKQINERFGQAEGDKVLKIFSEELLKHFRSSDVIARIGGDEFCVFCSGLELENLELLVERLKKSVQKHHGQGYSIEFTVACEQSQEGKFTSLEDMLSIVSSKIYYDKKNISF